MATLTYDSAESQEGEFTPEEQENIKVGEALEEQQGELLAGKFKDAEDLEKGYIELQKKLGEPREEPEEKTTEAEEEEKRMSLLIQLSWINFGMRQLNLTSLKKL